MPGVRERERKEKSERTLPAFAVQLRAGAILQDLARLFTALPPPPLPVGGGHRDWSEVKA